MIESSRDVHSSGQNSTSFIAKSFLFFFSFLDSDRDLFAVSTKWTEQTTFNICNLNAINFLSPLIPVDCSTF